MEDILIEKKDSILIIKLNRPSKKNALTISMYSELTKVFENAQNDDSIRVVVLSSTSNCFSAGNDLIDFRDNPPITDDAPVYNFVRTVAKFDKPIISAADGLAVGIGLTILLHCNFVFVTKEAKLMAPFVNLGLVPEFGSSKLLVDLIGERRASSIFLLGEMIPGEKAVELGIANSVVSAEELEEKAISTAQLLCEKPQTALRLSKALMRPKEELLEIIEREIKHFKKQVSSDNTKEAISAVLEKRMPSFK